jgi:hypothetical protein
MLHFLAVNQYSLDQYVVCQQECPLRMAHARHQLPQPVATNVKSYFVESSFPGMKYAVGPSV